MSRLAAILIFLAVSVMGTSVAAQEFSGLARVEAGVSRVTDTRGGIRIDIGLSQGVPYRVYTLPDPDRLVMDFREVDWTGLDPAVFDQAQAVSEVRFGGLRPGWSRMVIDLGKPMLVNLAELRTDVETGAAQLSVTLKNATREAFDVAPIPADLASWGMPGASSDKPVKPVRNGRLTVLIDPGHGGIDPGAERDGANEKNLMLLFAFDLRDALLRVDGVDVVLTREDDRFVSLERRVAIAHQEGADVFLSLHADALSEGHAHGAVLYTLSDEASDEASALLAERHNRADLLAGVDLTGSDDVIADVLLDLARMETQPRTEAMARSLVEALDKAGVPLNRRPYRAAAFSVLKAADIPSVLLEIGFLSSDRDLANLSDPIWRRKAAAGIRDGLQAWMITDDAARSLVRQ
ncbi:N-acetylmuramoyl-L-alanine amidase [Rhodobacteraceae bacterium LMO-12]|nr:N-acetylmuramoyl-L-alanine amidase [Rhodobacteraceae bacterium LMO-JJ12]